MADRLQDDPVGERLSAETIPSNQPLTDPSPASRFEGSVAPNPKYAVRAAFRSNRLTAPRREWSPAALPRRVAIFSNPVSPWPPPRSHPLAVSVPPADTPIPSSWPASAGIAGPHATARCFMLFVWSTCKVCVAREPGCLAAATRSVGAVVDTRMCRQDGDSPHPPNSSASQEVYRKAPLSDLGAEATSAGHTMVGDPAADTAVASLVLFDSDKRYSLSHARSSSRRTYCGKLVRFLATSMPAAARTALNATGDGLRASWATGPVRPAPTKQRRPALLLGPLLVHGLRHTAALLKRNQIPCPMWLPTFQRPGALRTPVAH